jgi:uncharacterized membrane protein YfcA
VILGIIIASKVGGAVLSAVFGIVALLVAIKMALPLEGKTLSDSVPGGPVTRFLF